jgi:hypothetical protein
MTTFHPNPHRFISRWALSVMLGITAVSSLAATRSVDPAQLASKPVEAGITMTGRCPNGDAFRLISYDKQVEGLWKSFYDYQGPVGSGTVRTQTVPRVMASRVCIALAEIASDEH